MDEYSVISGGKYCKYEETFSELYPYGKFDTSLNQDLSRGQEVFIYNKLFSMVFN